ncbi:GNAT family N-acetyltransferase [Adhaeribacter radiodurans]|uniref:GNAT family N-acetyltransferase n=1 Tax=Adhaeribacter radiodurans TaxID=2745197 RepID=A0A7L7L6K2_9BACT|nr:GNAT family N-acetyltransferase [Adhaeribacter radiodurans]QMU28466.1 GNAT family N-acetyltransferase [Adhaeribacter radiodurans]
MQLNRINDLDQTMHLIELTAIYPLDYKAFFQQGLRDHPDCFRTSPGDERWAYFPTEGTPESFTLAAITEQQELMGVVSFERETSRNMRHKALLYRMYVSKQFAGNGIGKFLIQNTLDRARQLPGLEQVFLTVIASNVKAKSLYSSFGFEQFSHEKNAIKTSAGIYYHEEQMVLFL